MSIRLRKFIGKQYIKQFIGKQYLFQKTVINITEKDQILSQIFAGNVLGI